MPCITHIRHQHKIGNCFDNVNQLSSYEDFVSPDLRRRRRGLRLR